jgi:hypothetical protein
MPNRALAPPIASKREQHRRRYQDGWGVEFRAGKELWELWTLPGPKSGGSKYALAGWSIAGITNFRSGTPFTVANGPNRNGFGTKGDRPDIGNPTAPVNNRAIIFPVDSTLVEMVMRRLPRISSVTMLTIRTNWTPNLGNTESN